METDTAFRRRYAIRRAYKGGRSLEVSLPYEVVDRAARQANLSMEAYLERYEAEVQYDGFDGIRVQFVRKEEDDESLSSQTLDVGSVELPSTNHQE